MSDRRVTLGDVARVAAVSPATVSRALRADPQISDKTRVRVRQVADELGYVPNVAARSLVLQQTSTFGLMTPDVTDPIHGQVVTAFEQRAMERGFSVILANGYGSPEAEHVALRTFASHRVAGVATMGTVLRQEEVVRLVAPSRVVFLVSENLRFTDFENELPYGCVRSDDRDGMRQVAALIVERGYRDVAFVGSQACASLIIRRETLVAELVERGLGEPTIHTLETYDEASFRSVARRLRDERADVVVCYDDKIALRLIDALRTVGLHAPDDVGVIGFDDIPFAAIANPRLTTVAQRSSEMGRMAVDMLAASLKSGELAPSLLLPVDLVVRESAPGERTSKSRRLRSKSTRT